MHISATLAQVSASSVDRNHEGFPTHIHGLRDQVRNFLRTGTLSGTFYVSARTLAKEVIDTLRAFGEQDAVSLSEETIAAREDGYMRTLPILSTVVLSGLPDKDLFRATAARVLKVPRDVAQFVEICKSGAVPGVKSFGGCRVGVVRTFMESISEYHAVKGTQSRKMALRDMVRLSHPRPSDKVSRELLGWLSGHVEGKRVRRNPQVMAFERLKRSTEVVEQVRLIREGRLPYEAVTAAVASPSAQVWAELLVQAPTFNLIRNLRTFARHGVFKDEKNVQLVIRRLTRAEALRKARILPFRAYQAWKAYSREVGADPRIIAALSDALEQSVANLPSFPGRMGVASDVSGSMSLFEIGKEPSWDRRKPSKPDALMAIDVASIFAAALLKQTPNAIVLPFAGEVIPISLNPRDSVLSNAQAISSLGGGSTSVAAPVEQLLRQRDKVDLYVGLTDNEEWVGRGFNEAWRQYKREVSPEAKAVLITVTPSKHRVVPESSSDVHYVHGWSDAVMRYVAEVASGLPAR